MICMLLWELKWHICEWLSIKIWIWILLYVASCTIMAISRQKEAQSRDYALLLFRMTSRVIWPSTIGSTVHSMPLNSLEHCICTATMTNIRIDRDSKLVPTNEPSRPALKWLHDMYAPLGVEMAHIWMALFWDSLVLYITLTSHMVLFIHVTLHLNTGVGVVL